MHQQNSFCISNSLCISNTVYVSEKQFMYQQYSLSISNTIYQQNSLRISKTVYVSATQFIYQQYSLPISNTVNVSAKQFMYQRHSLFISNRVYVSAKEFMYQQKSLCISNTVYVSAIQYRVYVSAIQFMYQQYGTKCMYQQYSLPAALCTPHNHTKISHTDSQGSSHKTNHTAAQVTLWTTRPYPVLLFSFKLAPLLKLPAPQTVWLSPNYYPHVMNIWLPFWSIHVFLRCRLLWKCESKQWHFILQNILKNTYKLFTVNIQLSFVVCCFKKVLSENTEYSSLGCVGWQNNQWCGVPRLFLASSRRATYEMRPAVKKAYQ